MSTPLSRRDEERESLYRSEMGHIKLQKESWEGEKVYIVSDDWLSQWCKHSGFAKESLGSLSERRDLVSSPSSMDKRTDMAYSTDEFPIGSETGHAAQTGLSPPGPVDNSSLFVLPSKDTDASSPSMLYTRNEQPDTPKSDDEESHVLREGLVEGIDYHIVHEPAWNLLVQWYDVKGEDHIITHEYQRDPSTNTYRVDIYNSTAQGKHHPGKTSMDTEPSPMSATQEMSQGEAHERSRDGLEMPKSLGINIPQFSSEKVIHYGVSTSPITSFGGGRYATSPLRGPLPTSPLGVGSPLSRSFGPVPIWAEDSVTMGSSTRRGLSGLANLGNTCFMNSSLQCLCHTPSLMYAFLSGQYKDDLNTENPLGLGGKLASAFGGLLSKVWRPGASFVTPKHFKWQLAKFAPQFGGYSQQDSQELLSFLLDGLHEDLNRIKEKPYKEEKDSDGRPDEEVALEAWNNYRARNDSVVVDHFQGLYKSTLKCPKCDYTSVKFDPFMYLSLPLPSPKRRTFQITVVDQADFRDPLFLAVRLPKLAPIGDLAREVGKSYSEHFGITQSNEEWVISQWNGKSLDLFLDDTATVESIPEKGSMFSYFSSRSYKLYAYRFAGSFIRPSMASRPVLLYHSSSQNACIPSLYFLPAKNISELVVEKSENSNYWKVEPDTTLREALETIVSHSEQVCITNDTSIYEEDSEKQQKSEDMDVDIRHTPYQIYFGGPNGQPKSTSYWTSSTPEIGPPDDPSPIYLYAEWKNAKPVSVIKESVVEHESIKMLEDQASRPFKATLSDCLECFCQPEQLDASDTWYCSKCKDHVKGIKKLDLWYLPPVLVVHLKRFSYSRYSRDKLDTHIEFPLHQLDLSGFISRKAFASSKKLRLTENGSSSDLLNLEEEEPIYDLYAVSNHFGGMGGGHYTAFCQMPDNKKWYDFDDSTVTEIDSKDVQSPAAYVLFYHRRGSDIGLATKALEVADSITHGQDAKVCDSPMKHISSPRFSMSRSSMDTLKENPSQENEMLS